MINRPYLVTWTSIDSEVMKLLVTSTKAKMLINGMSKVYTCAFKKKDAINKEYELTLDGAECLIEQMREYGLPISSYLGYKNMYSVYSPNAAQKKLIKAGTHGEIENIYHKILDDEVSLDKMCINPGLN